MFVPSQVIQFVLFQDTGRMSGTAQEEEELPANHTGQRHKLEK